MELNGKEVHANLRMVSVKTCPRYNDLDRFLLVGVIELVEEGGDRGEERYVNLSVLGSELGPLEEEIACPENCLFRQDCPISWVMKSDYPVVSFKSGSLNKVVKPGKVLAIGMVAVCANDVGPGSLERVLGVLSLVDEGENASGERNFDLTYVKSVHAHLENRSLVQLHGSRGEREGQDLLKELPVINAILIRGFYEEGDLWDKYVDELLKRIRRVEIRFDGSEDRLKNLKGILRRKLKGSSDEEKGVSMRLDVEEHKMPPERTPEPGGVPKTYALMRRYFSCDDRSCPIPTRAPMYLIDCRYIAYNIEAGEKSKEIRQRINKILEEDFNYLGRHNIIARLYKAEPLPKNFLNKFLERLRWIAKLEIDRFSLLKLWAPYLILAVMVILPLLRAAWRSAQGVWGGWVSPYPRSFFGIEVERYINSIINFTGIGDIAHLEPSILLLSYLILWIVFNVIAAYLTGRVNWRDLIRWIRDPAGRGDPLPYLMTIGAVPYSIIGAWSMKLSYGSMVLDLGHYKFITYLLILSSFLTILSVPLSLAFSWYELDWRSLATIVVTLAASSYLIGLLFMPWGILLAAISVIILFLLAFYTERRRFWSVVGATVSDTREEFFRVFRNENGESEGSKEEDGGSKGLSMCKDEDREALSWAKIMGYNLGLKVPRARQVDPAWMYELKGKERGEDKFIIVRDEYLRSELRALVLKTVVRFNEWLREYLRVGNPYLYLEYCRGEGTEDLKEFLRIFLNNRFYEAVREVLRVDFIEDPLEAARSPFYRPSLMKERPRMVVFYP